MDNNTFYNIANNYIEKLHTHSYELLVGKNNKSRVIVVNFDIDEYFHVSGLDHLTSILNAAKSLRLIHNIKKKYDNIYKLFSAKELLFKKIIDKTFLYSQIKSTADSELTHMVKYTYNTQTQKGYTFEDRLNTTSKIFDYLEKFPAKCQFMAWDKSQTYVELPKDAQKLYNSKYRNISINADYVLKIPTYDFSHNKDEFLYFFLVKSIDKQNYRKNTDNKLELKVISVFSDCVDITAKQKNIYSVLKADKFKRKNIDLTKYPLEAQFIENLSVESDRVNLFTSSSLTPPKTQFNQFQIYQPITICNSGTTAIDTRYPVAAFGSRPPFWQEILKQIKSVFKRLFVVPLKPQSKKITTSRNHSSTLQRQHSTSKSKTSHKEKSFTQKIKGKTISEQSCEKPKQVSQTGSVFSPKQINKNAAKISEKHDKSRSADKSKGRNNPDR